MLNPFRSFVARFSWRQQPVWLCTGLTLLLLVANDHWLKRSGELPGWFTGKASDFCALVVGPLCLLALMPRRGPTARALCIAAFALPYAAINLSVSCSDAVQALAAGFGLRLRLWSDAIDLIALSILPVTWFFSGIVAKPDPQPSGSRRSRFAGSLAEKVFGVAGIVSCIASGSDPTYSSWAYVINGTGQPLMVEYAETPNNSYSYSCEPHAQFVDNLLRYGDFTGQRARYRLAPGEFLPLPEQDYRCSPARITAAGVTLALAAQSDGGRTIPESPDAKEWRDRTRLVTILGDDIDGYSWDLGGGLYSFKLADDTAPLPTSDCDQLTQPRASMSGAHTITNATLLEIRPIGPSCLTLVIGQTPSLPMTDEPDAGEPVATLSDAADAGVGLDASLAADPRDGGVPTDAELNDATTEPPTLGAQGPTQEVYWCGPTEHFPFSVGQRISVSAGTVQAVSGSPFVRTAQGNIPFNTNAALGFTPEVSECGLVREACGAIWQPLDVTWNNGLRLIPGERNPLPALGRDVVLLRAARLIIPNEACEALYQNDEWFEWIDRELSP